MRKFLLALSVLALFPILVSADPITIENPLGDSSSFGDVLDKITDFLFKIAVVLSPLMIVVGAGIFVTSGGNLQKVSQAKRIIIWTAVAFLIIIMAKGIIALINQIILNN